MDPETTSETPSSASEADVAPPSLPGVAGRLTPEEQQKLMQVRDESRTLLQKIGEFEVQKARIMARLEQLEGDGQEAINAISRRLSIPDGQQWVALQDGTIRLVNQPATKEGAAPS
jgi:hypothetical protein